MKKLISIFLVLCMALTFLPTVAFANEGDGETVAPIVADFTKTPRGNGLAFSAVVGDGFTVVDSKCSTKGLASVWNGKGLQFNTYQYAGNLTVWPVDKSANQMFTVSVNAVTAGYYNPEFIYEAFDKSGVFSVYINGQYAGMVNASDETSATGIIRDVELNTVFLNEGANEVSFRCTGKEKTGGTWLILNKLTLTYCGADFSPVDFSGNLPTSINAGKAVEFSVSANTNENIDKFYATYNEAGTAITDPQGKVSVTSDDGTIVITEQTATGATGTFTATSGEKATITATTTINGTVYTKDFEIDVIAPIVADFTSIPKTRGITIEQVKAYGFDVVEEKTTTRGMHSVWDGKGLQSNHYLDGSVAGLNAVWPDSIHKNLMFTMNVTAANAGYYSPEFVYETFAKSGDFAIYINRQYAGTVKAFDATSTSGNTVAHTAKLNTVYLAEGENEVSFKCVAHGIENNGSWFIFDKLILTPCDSVPAATGFISTLPAKATENEAVEFTLKPVMSDGTKIVFGTHKEDGSPVTEMPITLTATSGEISDLAIISDGLSGKFTASEAGTAIITATTTINGTTYTDTFNVTVASDEDEVVTLPTTISMSVATNETFAGNLTVNGEVQEGAVRTYSVGTGNTVTVKAADIDGKIFRGWLRGGENGKVVCIDSEYTFTAATNIALFAKYTDAPAGNTEAKEYYDWNGEFLSYEEPERATLSKYGFSFKEWLEAAEELITRYVADYQADDTYVITKPDGTKEENVLHETLVTLTNATPVSWYSNGALVAYGTSYSFYVTEDAKITVDSEVQEGPIAKLTNPEGNTYILEYNANGKEIIEKGIVIGNGTPNVTSCFYKVISQRTDSFGKLMTNNDTDYTVVRGYIIYNDGGTYRVVYADIAE